MTFDECVARFNKTRQNHRQFGTCDSEPYHIFRNLIRRALKGKPVTIPTTAQGWEIYSDMDGADIVAATLAADVEPCVEMAKQASNIVMFAED
jgi:hypothetical protein